MGVPTLNINLLPFPVPTLTPLFQILCILKHHINNKIGCWKMKTSDVLSHLLLVLIFTAGLASDLVLRGRAHGVRIPEHWCHKLIRLSNCEPQKCSQECSKEPYGIGECKDATCFCTYYCKGPPL